MGTREIVFLFAHIEEQRDAFFVVKLSNATVFRFTGASQNTKDY